MDEVFFEVNCKLSHTWGPKGRKVIVKNNGSNGKDCVIGVVSPYEGESFFLQWDWIDARVVARFLKLLSRRYPDKKHLIIYVRVIMNFLCQKLLSYGFYRHIHQILT